MTRRLGALTFREEAWNAHPFYAKNVIRNPAFIYNTEGIEMHTYCEDDDNGSTDNVHNLSEDQLSERRVCRLDIAEVPELGHQGTDEIGASDGLIICGYLGHNEPYHFRPMDKRQRTQDDRLQDRDLRTALARGEALRRAVSLDGRVDLEDPAPANLRLEGRMDRHGLGRDPETRGRNKSRAGPTAVTG